MSSQPVTLQRRRPRRADAGHVPSDVDAGHLRTVGRAAGLAAVGVARAEVFADTRRHLQQRRAAGLAAGMQFTYRNPERSTDPTRLLAGARSLVVGAYDYRRAAPPPSDRPDPDGPAPDRTAGRRPPAGRVARYAREDHYAALAAALEAIAAELRRLGWRARVVVDDNGLVDREAAYRAGLGWYGKSANLLLPGRGSWFVLGSVVTDAELAPDRPLADGCGSCRRCLDGCPTGAIVAPGVVDARRCLAWLVQAPGTLPVDLRVALGDRIYGCDDCQEVCPPNRHDERRRPAPPAATSAQAWVDLLDLLAATDAELLDRHGRWYLAGRQPRWLRRNALVALGNTADPLDTRVVGALAAHLAHPDPVLRAHATWAARRLGLDALAVAAARDDPDEAVRSELEGEVASRAAGLDGLAAGSCTGTGPGSGSGS